MKFVGQNQNQAPLVVPLPPSGGNKPPAPQVYPVSLGQGQNQNQAPLVIPLPPSGRNPAPSVYPVSLSQGQNQNQSPLIVPIPSSGGNPAPQVYPVSLSQGLYKFKLYLLCLSKSSFCALYILAAYLFI